MKVVLFYIKYLIKTKLLTTYYIYESQKTVDDVDETNLRKLIDERTSTVGNVIVPDWTNLSRKVCRWISR